MVKKANLGFNLDTIVQQAQVAAGSTDLSDVRIKFQQYDNLSITSLPSDGRKFDNIQVTAQDSTVVAQSVPYTQSFDAGKPGGADGWEYYSDNEGQIEVVSGRLRMDDHTYNSTHSLNEAILHLNLTGQSNVVLELDHWSIGDENHSLPSSFTGHYKGDGISLSVDGTNWVKVTDLTSSSLGGTFNLDTIVQQAQVAAGSTDLSDVRIKFQQYDNLSIRSRKARARG